MFSLAPAHAVNRPDTLQFPFNQRRLMGPWSFFFSANVRFKPNAAQSAEWNRGAYVAESHCGDGHTPGNLAFALDNRRKRRELRARLFVSA